MNLKNQPVDRSNSSNSEIGVVDETVKLKHERSKQLYPNLNLSEDEYVIVAVKRHPIGLVVPIVTGTLIISLAFILLFNFDLVAQAFMLDTDKFNLGSLFFPVSMFIAFIVLGVYLFYYIYTNNKFFLTNESVIQEVQTGLFNRLEQTVSLSNIEDASFTQIGIIQLLFDYGSIRLSTEGDETTYRFSYVASPKNHIAILNNTIEAFKNGKPIEG